MTKKIDKDKYKDKDKDNDNDRDKYKNKAPGGKAGLVPPAV